MEVNKLKLAVFISGTGSNMLSIMEACKIENYPAEVSVVLSNNPDAKGLNSAQKSNIATEIVNHKDFASSEYFEDEIIKRLKNYKIDLIVLAGFMRILTPSFVKKFPDKIINIHPSLLPEYKGLNTHERAINDGKKEAGCTVHFVNSELDSGKIILQNKVPIIHGDTPDTLAKRVLRQEHKLYPQAIEIIASSIRKS